MQLTSSTERSVSGSAGLSSADAERRLADVGPNTLAEEKGPSPARQLAANFVQPLALLLWACAGLALLADMPTLTVAIAAVVVINALFSFFEEYKAERAVSELRRLLPSQVRVRRDGAPVEVAVVALLAYTPGLQRVFHTSGLSGDEWLFLLIWPPLVLGAEELRKAGIRRRRP
jgi:magnesium-transporting ATPase (P-type)